jgi:predicted secreted protein
MAVTEARIGYGVQLARGDGSSPEVFTAVAELIDLSPPNIIKDQVEATHTDSPDGFREFIPGLKDGGEFTATMNFLPTDSTQDNTTGGLLYDFLNETLPRNWRITFPGGSPQMSWTFLASVTGYEVATPMDDRMTLTVTFRVSGTLNID